LEFHQALVEAPRPEAKWAAVNFGVALHSKAVYVQKIPKASAPLLAEADLFDHAIK